MFSNLGFEVGDDGVALLTIHVTDHARNVFTPHLAADLAAALALVAERDDVVGAVITSGRDNGFLCGPDASDWLQQCEQSLGDAAQRRAPLPALTEPTAASRVLRLLDLCAKPVAAAINGAALGTGYELCLACHHRVLADTPQATVGLPEVSWGLLPAAGGTQRLPRLIGIAAALPLLLSGRAVPPEEALKLGLVDQLRPQHLAELAARQWVHTHAGAQQPWNVKGFRVPGGAGALAPHAYASFGLNVARVRRDTQDNEPAPLAILAAVFEGTQLPLDRALALEARYLGQLLSKPVTRNLVRAEGVYRERVLALHAQRPAAFEPGLQAMRQAYADAGRALLQAGASPVLINNSARMAGLAHSPLLTTLATLATLTTLAETSPEAEAGTPPQPSARPWSVDDIGRALLSAVSLAAAGVCEASHTTTLGDPAALDVLGITQLGLPRWTGGPLSYIDTLGPAAFVEQCDALARRCGPLFAVPPELRERARQGRPFYTSTSPNSRSPE